MDTYQHRAWAWLKAELRRRLGDEEAARLWAEHARLARIDRAEASVARQRSRLSYHTTAINAGFDTDYHQQRRADAQARLTRAEAKAARVREEAGE